MVFVILHQAVNPMLKEKVAYWSGPAAAIGGILQLLPSSCWFPNVSDTSVLWLGLPGFILIAIGLAGLYLRFRTSASRGSTAAFGPAFAGILLVASNMAIRLVNGPEETAALPFLVIPGMLLLIVGLTVIGVFAISRQVLRTLSFVPLALAGGNEAIMISFGLVLSNPAPVIVAQIAHSLTMLAWLLQGAALWRQREEKVAKTALQISFSPIAKLTIAVD